MEKSRKSEWSPTAYYSCIASLKPVDLSTDTQHGDIIPYSRKNDKNADAKTE
jgi:hypothetical protein